MSQGMKNYGKLNIPDFIWWLGVVEDNNDPAYAGRVKVRITGYHTGNKQTLPIKHLPYAVPINSVTSAGLNGVMENHSLLQGSTVIGFFADGEDGQIPMILGTIAGKPAEKPEVNDIDGFMDPTGRFPRLPDEPDQGFAGVGEPDVSRLARNEAAETHYSLLNRRATRDEGIRTARAPSVSEETGDAILDDITGKDYEGKTWDEPHPRGKSKDEANYFDAAQKLRDGESPQPGDKEWTSLYPFNTVKETRAGHVFEIDNTETNRRIHEYHPSGTNYEIHDDGTKVTNIVGDNYEIIAKDNNVLIRGSCNVTIAGDAKLLVQGDKYEEVEGDYFLSILGSRVTKINGNDIKSVISDVTHSIKGNRTARVAQDDTETIVGNQTISVAKNRTDSVAETVNKTYNKDLKSVKENVMVSAGGTYRVLAGDNVFLAATGLLEVGSGSTMTIKTLADLDMDADVSMTIDSPTMSIDGPAGNITSNNITLHTHTHKEVPGTGGSSSPQPSTQETQAPTSGT